MRILLVEDHLELSRWIGRALQDAHLTVEFAMNGADADSLLHTQEYALVILDLTLPKMDGLDVLRRMRARGSRAPVLILTARGGLNERGPGPEPGRRRLPGQALRTGRPRSAGQGAAAAQPGQ